MTPDPFPITSRYHGVETARRNSTVYLRRRFVPPPERFATLFEHTVQSGDRIDNIAARYLGDPEQYWRIADANAAMRPDDLTQTPGGRVRITLPEGIPGPANAQ